MSAAVDALEPLAAELSLRPSRLTPAELFGASAETCLAHKLRFSMESHKPLTPPTPPLFPKQKQSQRFRKLWRKAARKLATLGKGCARVPRNGFLLMLPGHWVEVFDPLHRCHLKVSTPHPMLPLCRRSCLTPPRSPLPLLFHPSSLLLCILLMVHAHLVSIWQ